MGSADEQAVDPDFWKTVPRKRLGSGALVTDAAGRVLIVDPSYKSNWEIPGGIVEDGETAPVACERECNEELGVDIPAGRLLVIDQQTDPSEKGDSVMFVYDGGSLEASRIDLQDEELQGFRFVDPGELNGLTNERVTRRIRAAVEARASGRVIELIEGEQRDPASG